MGLIVKNLSAVLARMARTEDRVARGSIKALRDAAKVVVLAARLNAPRDTGELEEAIVARELRERTILGRFGATTIQVGVDVSLLDLSLHAGHDYSITMHEDPDYKLGPNSVEKQKSNPGITVGYKYLERALKENQAAIEKSMKTAIERSL